MAIRAVIFDYGEVLSYAPEPGNWDGLAEVSGVPMEALRTAYWRFRDEYDQGLFTGEEYWAKVGAETSRELPPPIVEQLIELDWAQWSRLNEPMVAWACSLPERGIRTAVLSNMPQELHARMHRDFSWLPRFSHQTFSCLVGCSKPAEAIYHHCLKGLGTLPEETLFLDDRAVNVEAARKLGIEAHVFTSMADLPAIAGPLLTRA